MLQLLLDAWRRFWDLSWWWKGPLFGIAAFVALIISLAAARVGGGDDKTEVLEATREPTATAATATPSPTPQPTEAPAVEPTSTPTARAIPQEIITVMTYNILGGGGVGPTDPEGEWCCGPPRGCCHEPGGNRLPRILEVIRAADPDILGIQEACLWQLDDQSIAREVAAELGMNYFIDEAADPDASHVVLFTKFDIKNAESYPTQFAAAYGRAGLHAEVVTHGGQPIHIFVVHLRPEEGYSEVSFLIEEMSPYLGNLTVLMGDMNFVDPSWQASMLHEAGWSHPLAGQQGIDQIWVSPALASDVQPAPPIPTELTLGTSDHTPVVVEIATYLP